MKLMIIFCSKWYMKFFPVIYELIILMCAEYVITWLRPVDDFTQMSITEIARCIESKNSLCQGTVNKKRLFYHIRNFISGQDGSHDSLNSTRKKGRFSKSEDRALKALVDSFLTANKLTVEDICTQLRKGGMRKDLRFSKLYQEIQEYLPNRSLKA